MAATLKLTGGTSADLDLSAFLNAVEGEGLDPAPGAFLEPQFTDSSVGDGQELVNIDVGNSDEVWPLHLKAASKDALHALVRTLRRKLNETGVMVLWQDNGATDATYRDLEFGRWEPGYRYHRARHFMLSGTLRCWASSYGHTATERIVGTMAASGFMQMVSVPSIAGDAGAQIVCELTAVATQQQEIFGLSVVPSGVLTEWRAASLSAGSATSVLTGASGAVGSQYNAIYASPTAVQSVQRLFVPMTGREGDQRVLMLARTPNLGGINLFAQYAQNRRNATAFLGATYAVGAQPDVWDGWQLVDLGVVRAARASMAVATHTLDIFGSLASFAAGSLIASPGLHVAALYVVPEDRTALVLDNRIHSSPNSPVFDGLLRETYQRGGVKNAHTDRQRGDFPVLSPGSGEQVAVFSAGRASNDEAAAVVRVRERFTFQR